MIIWILLAAAILLFVFRRHEGFNTVSERPVETDEILLRTIRAYVSIPDDGKTDAEKLELARPYVTLLQKFYDEVYSPGGKNTPTTQQVTTFVGAITDANIKKEALPQLIDYVFTGPDSPSPPAEGSGSTVPPLPDSGTGTGSTVPPLPDSGTGTGTGSTVPPMAGNQSSPNINRASGSASYARMAIAGPRRTFEENNSIDYNVSETTVPYPGILGPMPSGVNAGPLGGSGPGAGAGGGAGLDLPSTSSLGSDPNSQYLPTSRTPGDMDIIPDPYRVSTTYSPASHSSKTEPVPFLTDFSKFMK